MTPQNLLIDIATATATVTSAHPALLSFAHPAPVSIIDKFMVTDSEHATLAAGDLRDRLGHDHRDTDEQFDLSLSSPTLSPTTGTPTTDTPFNRIASRQPAIVTATISTPSDRTTATSCTDGRGVSESLWRDATRPAFSPATLTRDFTDEAELPIAPTDRRGTWISLNAICDFPRAANSRVFAPGSAPAAGSDSDVIDLELIRGVRREG